MVVMRLPRNRVVAVRTPPNIAPATPQLTMS